MQVIRPQPGKQEMFLSSPADVAIYGGAAGGGKSYALLLEPLRHVGVRGFGAVCFRRTYPRITAEGGLWDTSVGIYGGLGAAANRSALQWRFASGAKIGFAHLQYEESVLEYHGAQIALVLFDELPEFGERQFWYMFSRNRSTCGVRPYVRATCNPDADSWVARLIAWWIDQATGYPIPERAGVVRWFLRVGYELEWGDSAPELAGRCGAAETDVKSLTFIPATVFDNRILLERDPGYLANLRALMPVEQERLLGGNWKVRYEAGKVVNRSWFKVVERAPAGGLACRCWDFAASEKKQRGDDPDFTAGALVRKVGGRYAIEDCVAAQVGPAQGDALFVNTCVQDGLRCRQEGIEYRVRWEEEGGASGKKESLRLVRLLAAEFGTHGLPLDAQGVRPEGDKLTRGKTFASHARVGDVDVVAGEWNEAWLREMHGFPDGPHDDVWDATVGAFNALANVEPGAVTGAVVAPEPDPDAASARGW